MAAGLCREGARRARGGCLFEVEDDAALPSLTVPCHLDDLVLSSNLDARDHAMSAISLNHRLATRDDMSALAELMSAAISELQKPFLSEEQIASSRAIMGLDTQLIDDGTYFIVEQNGALAGCGGWSRRATLYGGDRSPGRDVALLDPASDAARVRAMYTHPRFTRRGVGRLILTLCEDAARAEGFTRVELMATMAGEPLYRACGFEAVEDVVDGRGGADVPLLRMRKVL
jgi:GNAT superfamily N-acetyltransferase